MPIERKIKSRSSQNYPDDLIRRYAFEEGAIYASCEAKPLVDAIICLIDQGETHGHPSARRWYTLLDMLKESLKEWET